jgi:hypothetical protein
MCFIFCPEIIYNKYSSYDNIFPYYADEIYNVNKDTLNNELFFSDLSNHDISKINSQIENLQILKKNLVCEIFYFSHQLQKIMKSLNEFNIRLNHILLI